MSIKRQKKPVNRVSSSTSLDSIKEVVPDSEQKEILFNELMILEYKIKMCKRLRRAGLGYFKALSLKTKLKAIYYRKLKLYAELIGFDFIGDVIAEETAMKLTELQHEMYKLCGIEKNKDDDNKASDESGTNV